MLINNTGNESEHVKFVSYSGKYPNLCSGILILDIDGKEVKFGNSYLSKEKIYDSFWTSGGSCGFRNGYSESYVNHGEWEINVDMIPDEYKKYASEIDDVFNSNVPNGCCGGCL